MWDLRRFEAVAKDIAQGLVKSGGEESINSLATKIAEANSLNPLQIQTMVRLANVAAFQELFEKKADGDKMVEFEPGDPDVVINNLHANAANNFKEAQEKTAGYNRAQDYYGDFVAPVEKEAEEEPPKEATEVIKVNPLELKGVLKEAKDAMRLEGYSKEFAWKETIEKVAQALRLRHGSSVIDEFPAFEKDAVATFGVDVLPELRLLYGAVGGDVNAPRLGEDKVASVREHHLVLPNPENAKVLSLLKKAAELRDGFTQCVQGQKLMSEYVEKVNALIAAN